LIEIRGDEALAVFSSARQAIRAALDLQAQFDEETEADAELPLRVGIGIDSGEAVALEDGGYRGAALNIAARLCGRAHGGDVLISEGTARLAGRLAGVRYVDRGRARLKNVSDPVHAFQVYSELDSRPANRWVLMFFGRPARTFGWKLALGVMLIAAGTAGAVVYFTARGPEGSRGAASVRQSTMPSGTSDGGMATDHTMTTTTEAQMSPLEQLTGYAAAHKWTCSELDAIESGVQAALQCQTEYRTYPIAFEMSVFRNQRTLRSAYEAEMAKMMMIKPNMGRCTANSWQGEMEWLHAIDEPGGRAFCHLDEPDQRAHVTWTSEAGRRPILVIAKIDSLQHRFLFQWWRRVRHDIV